MHELPPHEQEHYQDNCLFGDQVKEADVLIIEESSIVNDELPIVGGFVNISSLMKTWIIWSSLTSEIVSIK